MIRLSRRTDYGVMAIRHLAELPAGSYCCAREIAARHGIPQALTAKLLQRLARRGLVASQHGTRGGYQIARPASQITLGQILEAIEGPYGLTECSRCSSGRTCPHQGACTVQEPLQAVHRTITTMLDRTTLRDLTRPAGPGRPPRRRDGRRP